MAGSFLGFGDDGGQIGSAKVSFQG